MAVLAAMVAAACGSTTPEPEPKLVAHYASFEVVAGRPQRILVGLSSGDADLVAFGTVRFAFSYLGTREFHFQSPMAGPEATADFRPLPGHRADSSSGPRVVPASTATGVYGADSVRLDPPGFWRVTVNAQVGGATDTPTPSSR